MKDDKTIDIALEKDSKKPVRLDPTLLMKHSLILAQSGYGKSFMLGRLIEEIAIKTIGRVIIFDPNSDFIHICNPDPAVWNDDKLRPWFFPKENHSNFTKGWSKVNPVIASNHFLRGVRRLVIEWGSLDWHAMASVLNINIRDEADLFWCMFLAANIALSTWDDTHDAHYDFNFFKNQALSVIDFLTGGEGTEAIKKSPLAIAVRKATSGRTALTFRGLIASLNDYDIWRSQGDGQCDIGRLTVKENSRVIEVDLQSLARDEERIAVTNRIMDCVWDKRRNEHWEANRDLDREDQRVPLFIVIDEAHNLAPQSSKSSSIRNLSEKLVRIAAEGRKYGIFLIIATQRPRKINSNILTECDNLFLMRLNNEHDFRYVKDALGFLRSNDLKLSRTADVGDILFAGSIGVSESILHVAPRRTIQGGRSIPKTYWLH